MRRSGLFYTSSSRAVRVHIMAKFFMQNAVYIVLLPIFLKSIKNVSYMSVEDIA